MAAAAAAATALNMEDRSDGGANEPCDKSAASRHRRGIGTVIKTWRSRRRPSWGAVAAASDGAGDGGGETPAPPPPPTTAAAPAAPNSPGGILEAAIPPDTVSYVFAFLDTRTTLALTRVSRAVCRQARLQVRRIDSEAVQVVPPEELLYGPAGASCIAWVGGWLRLTWRKSLFQPPPYPRYEYPQGNPHNPALSALIQALPLYPNLGSLALEYRNVRCEDCLSLAAAVASGRACGQLRSLNVSCNFLRAEGGKALGACLRHLPGLTELVLNDNSIYYEAVAGICEALRDGACPKLETFCLAYNWVGVLGSREIGALLGSGRLRHLRFLDLRGNGITSVGLCFFVEALLLGAKAAAVAAAAARDGESQGPNADPFSSEASFYRRFYLHEQGRGGSDGGSMDGAGGLSPPIASPCPFLDCVDLSFNYISEEGALALAEAIRLGLFPRLREIRVAQNPLDDHTGGLRLRAACAPWCQVVY